MNIKKTLENNFLNYTKTKSLATQIAKIKK